MQLAHIDFKPAVVTALAVQAVLLGSALLFGLPAALLYCQKRHKAVIPADLER